VDSLTVDRCLTVILGVTFLVSAVLKLRHPKAFLLTVYEYRVLPQPLGHLYATGLPPLELYLGIALLSGTGVIPGCALAIMLLASFVVGIGVNVARGRVLDCGCLGLVGRRTVGWPLVIQDVLLLAVALAALLIDDTRILFEPTLFFNDVVDIVERDGMSIAACILITAGLTIMSNRLSHFPRLHVNASP